MPTPIIDEVEVSSPNSKVLLKDIHLHSTLYIHYIEVQSLIVNNALSKPGHLTNLFANFIDLISDQTFDGPLLL